MNNHYSPKLKLIIEVDGSSHLNKGEYDACREDTLKSLGYTVVRFTEGEVLNNMKDVKRQLDHVIYCLLEGPLPYATLANFVKSTALSLFVSPRRETFSSPFGVG